MTNKICPLDRFRIEKGQYTFDPVEACLNCNCGDTREKDFDNVCKCPEGISWDDYEKLKKDYSNQENEVPSRHKFIDFINKVKQSL